MASEYVFPDGGVPRAVPGGRRATTLLSGGLQRAGRFVRGLVSPAASPASAAVGAGGGLANWLLAGASVVGAVSPLLQGAFAAGERQKDKQFALRERVGEQVHERLMAGGPKPVFVPTGHVCDEDVDGDGACEEIRLEKTGAGRLVARRVDGRFYRCEEQAGGKPVCFRKGKRLLVT